MQMHFCFCKYNLKLCFFTLNTQKFLMSALLDIPTLLTLNIYSCNIELLQKSQWVDKSSDRSSVVTFWPHHHCWLDILGLWNVLNPSIDTRVLKTCRNTAVPVIPAQHPPDIPVRWGCYCSAKNRSPQTQSAQFCVYTVNCFILTSCYLDLFYLIP